MKRYEEYRDSGVEWLGKIPAHWEILKSKRIFKQENRPVHKSDEVITAFRDGTVTLRSNRRTEGFTNSILEIGYQGIRKGDLVIHAMDAFAGAIGVSDSDGKATPVYAVCTLSRKANAHFFAWLLRYMARTGYILSLAKGIRERSTDFRFTEFAVLQLPVPPSEEQDAIVSFLDHKLAEIDQFIANKNRLINLLDEQKAAIINRAITRGIEPNVPVKESGIKWLGEIPAHWEVRRAKYLFREVNERSVTGSEELLSVSHITGVTPRSEKNVTMFMAESYEGYKTCKPNDLVINIMWSWMGAAGVSSYEGIVSSAYGVYRQIHSSFNQRYLDYLVRTRAYIAEFTCHSTGIHSSRLRMYTEDFFNVLMIQPSFEEQQSIISYIDQKLSEIDATISRVRREIELVKEYRTTLISEVVTGKIDVRATIRENLPV